MDQSELQTTQDTVQLAGAPTANNDGYTTELVTKVAYLVAKTDKKGNVLRDPKTNEVLTEYDSVSETEFQTLVAEVKAANAKIEAENAQIDPDSGIPPKELAPVPEPARITTFMKYTATTPDGCHALIPEDKQFVKEINRAIGIKQNAFIRNTMTADDTDFAAWINDSHADQAPFDLADVCAKETERKQLTTAEKIQKLMGSASAEEMAAILQQVMAQMAAAAQGSAVATS